MTSPVESVEKLTAQLQTLRNEIARANRESIRIQQAFLQVEVARLEPKQRDMFHRMYRRSESQPLSEIVSGLTARELKQACNQVTQTIFKNHEKKENPSECDTPPNPP